MIEVNFVHLSEGFQLVYEVLDAFRVRGCECAKHHHIERLQRMGAVGWV